MRKQLIGFFILILSIGSVTGQILKPYEFKTSVRKDGPQTYTLIIDGTLEPGWHLYSQYSDPDGSSPLTLQWEGAGKDYELEGPAKETGTQQAYNDIFEVTETFWADKVHLEQPIKLKNDQLKTIPLHLEGQVCKDACIQVNEDLTFDLSKAVAATGDQTASATTASTESHAPPATTTNEQTAQKKAQEESSGQETIEVEQPHSKSLWWIFWMSLIAGLVALLTPCIYPMIPLTISFFTKKNEQDVFGGNSAQSSTHGRFYAIMYGVFIIVIYVLLSLPFHLLDDLDPNIFNKISTNPWLNLAFFIIFFIFALSFMGVSKLDPQRLIPSKWISKSDEMSNKTSGLIAVFFMSLTLILVSFSCTGPILGALLGSVLGSSQGAWALTVGTLGFGIGLSIPFTLFALFPSMLKSLPRSGGWLNTVKVSLGFVELALAFKFLSNADLVLQLHLLEREVFLSIWIAIFLALSLYLFGMFKLPYDDDSNKIGVTRLLFALMSLAFTFYMLPGLWGAPLKWISAFPPYQSYSESPNGVGCHTSAIIQNNNQSTKAIAPKGAEYLHGGLTVFKNNYDDAIAYARQTGKPLMLDFTGFACVNCRKMENNVWTDPAVHQVLRDSLIIVSLYVDDKRKLPEDEQYISPYSNKKITLAGDKWAEMEIYKYKSNSQPYYVLISPDEELLNQPIAYEPDPKAYLQWLREGLGRYYQK